MKYKIVQIQLDYAGELKRVRITRDRGKKDAFGHNLFTCDYAITSVNATNRIHRVIESCCVGVGVLASIVHVPKEVQVDRMAYDKWLKEAR